MSDSYEHLPLAQVESESSFSLIWIIPLVAFLVGGWLVYKVYSEKGDIITLTFDSAEGIEVKKTPIRYKDVTVGKVVDIKLDPNLEKVQIKAEIEPFMAKHLGPETRFWAVRPRVSVQGISGLTTLLSGIYIGIDPGKEGKAKTVYEGLDTPPRVTSHTHGKAFTLQADKLGSVDVGSPIYYRQIHVGEVIKYELNSDRDTVGIRVFINEPYDEIVRRNTLFWNISGLDIELSASGDVKARMESLTSLLIGGLAFETPQSGDVSLPIDDKTVFPLYKSWEQAKEKNKGDQLFYVMYFSESLRGLTVGAPVEYRGIPIGKVEDVQLKIDEFNDEIKIPVQISIYAEKLSIDGDPHDAEDILIHMVKKGIRGQLTTSNLLTGTQFISLVYPENASDNPGEIKASSESGLANQELPTTSGLTTILAQSATDIMNEIHGGIKDARKLIASPEIKSSTKDIAAILKNVSSLLKDIKPEIIASMEGLSATLKNTQAISGKLNHQTMPLAKQLNTTLKRLDGALAEAQKTLASADTVLNEDSGLQYELRLLIEEVSEAANSFTVLANTLQRKPNSVIFGK